MSSIPEWLNLPHDLVGRVITRLPVPADRARLRAVCRPWRSAMRLHVSPPKQLPWVIFLDGSFSAPLDSCSIHRLPLFPKNTRCVSSTNDWLSLDCTDEVTRMHSYSLHNPFTGATVPLPELDSLIGKVPGAFQIRKVLMRSTPDDLVAVTCNIWRCTLILCRPGKGAWVPRLAAKPFYRIIDVAFSGDKLYAITKAEELFALHIADHSDRIPTVSAVKMIIRHASVHNVDNEEDLDEEALEEQGNYDNVPSEVQAQVESAGDGLLFNCEAGVNQKDNIIQTCRHLVESHGKLFMIRREWLISAFTPTDHTRKVEVFEADIDAGTWVPVANGLGGLAMFINMCFSRSVFASGEVEQDLIYFPDTNDVYAMRRGIVRPLGPMSRSDEIWRVWLFPPDLVV